MKFPIIFIFKAVSAFNGWLFSHIHMDSHLKFKVWNLLFVELYSVILLIRQNELWPANSKSDDNCVVKKWINFLSCLSLAEYGASTKERQPVKRHDWQPRPSSHQVLHKPAFGLNCSCPGLPILLCLWEFLKPEFSASFSTIYLDLCSECAFSTTTYSAFWFVGLYVIYRCFFSHQIT